jgi:hypothetical protein
VFDCGNRENFDFKDYVINYLILRML